MCASTLDVEGIIERPRTITTFPVMPHYALGAFLFRDHSAIAISLRKKLKVREGEDSVKGPFIAARIRDAIVAFWVDEVKDVIEEKDTAWQPMPEMLAGGLFDRFAIREKELILHTSFAALLEAEVEIQSVARWAASQIDSGVTPVPAPVASAAAPETAPLLGSETAAAGAESRERTESAEAPGGATPDKTPPIVETSSARYAGAGAQDKDADRVGDRVEHAAPAAIETKARAAAADVPRSSEGHEVPGSVAAREAPFESTATATDAAASKASGAGAHRQTYPRHSYSGTTGSASVPTRADVRPGMTGNTALEALSTVISRNIFEADRRPRSSTRTWIGGAVLAIAVLVAMLYAFLPGFLGDARPTIASALPATSTVPAVASPEPEPATRQIVSIKSEALNLTVERPTDKDAQPAAAKPAAAASAAPPRPKGPNTRTHIVVRGDTLWDIAKKHVGDPYRYPELAEFSNIRNPDLIYPGDIVRIEIRENRK
jgi:chemotaxis signal transduction protein/LysM repeat protein